jgi:hypothetical protein
MTELSAVDARNQATLKRLLRVYNKIAFPPQEDACWLWKGSRNKKGGYGRVRFAGGRWVAHRLTYKLFVGEIPAGLTLDHLCRTPSCVNPTHLEPVTNAENIRRGTQGHQQRAKTHCPRGHTYDVLNTYVNRRGQRICRTCQRERMRERRRRG